MTEVKPIVLRDEENNKVYTLRFTRATVKKLEKMGFNMAEADSKAMTSLEELFYGAFLADQPYMQKKDTDTILYEKLGGLSNKMIDRLGDLLAEPYKTLLPNEDEINPHNMTVEM